MGSPWTPGLEHANKNSRSNPVNGSCIDLTRVALSVAKMRCSSIPLLPKQRCKTTYSRKTGSKCSPRASPKTPSGFSRRPRWMPTGVGNSINSWPAGIPATVRFRPRSQNRRPLSINSLEPASRSMDLSTNYLGLKLRTPMVVSASPLSEEIDMIKQLEDAGASAVVLYSLFEEQLRRDNAELAENLEQGTFSTPEALTYFPEAQEFRLGPE